MITITLGGQAVAVTIGNNATITAELSEDDRWTVEAMCLYALKIQRGELPGPYTEQGALQFAWQTLDEIEAETGELARAARSHGSVEQEEPDSGTRDASCDESVAGCHRVVPIQRRAGGKELKGDEFRPPIVHDGRMDRGKRS